MKILVAVLGIAAFVNTGKAEDPRSVSRSDVAAIVATITRGEPVRITDGASGFNLYGKEKSGRVGSSAGGLSISYGGETYRAARTSGGWAISGNGFSARVASRAGGAAISGDASGSTAQSGTNPAVIRVDCKTLRAYQSAGDSIKLQ